MSDFHIGDIVRNRNTGGKSVVRAEGLWGSRFYELVACPHDRVSSECRRITDPAPQPFAVRHAERRTCIEALADGWCLADDMCPACTRQFMAALDRIAGPMKWSQGFRERAGVES